MKKRENIHNPLSFKVHENRTEKSILIVTFASRALSSKTVTGERYTDLLSD